MQYTYIYSYMSGIIILIIIFISSIIAWFWAKGIDYMNENHSDYKGEDFLEDLTKSNK
jgi:hypothetical protein